jgi:hypothetical protein
MNDLRVQEGKKKQNRVCDRNDIDNDFKFFPVRRED